MAKGRAKSRPTDSAKKKPAGKRTVESIDLLVHPFFSAMFSRLPARKGIPERTQEEIELECKQMAERWKDRVRVIQRNPNAVLIVAAQDPRAVWVIEQSSAMSNAERKAKFQLSEAVRRLAGEFHQYCEKTLGRRFIPLEWGITEENLNRALEERRLEFAKAPKVFAYGDRLEGCVRAELKALTEYGVPFDPQLRRTKIVPSLSVGNYPDRFAMDRIRKKHGEAGVRRVVQEYEQVRKDAKKAGMLTYRGLPVGIKQKASGRRVGGKKARKRLP